MRLAEILLERGWISPGRLRSLIGYQNLEDEQLATGLLEEGLLTADQLAVALGVLFGVAPALERDFAHVDPGLLKRMRARQAETLKSIPLYTTPTRRVAVAMVHPTDSRAIDDLGFALGAAIEPMVTSEPVLARQLELLYSMPRCWTTGFHPVSSHAVGDVGRAPMAPMSAADSRPINLMPLAVNSGSQFEAPTPPPRSSARPALPQRPRQPTQSYLAAVSDVPLFVPADPGAPAQVIDDGLSRTPLPPMVASTGPDASVEKIASATDRQSAADHLFVFMRSCFGAGAMFVVAGVFAEGRFGYNQGSPCPGIEGLVFSLSLPSCFHTAYRQGALFHGSPLPEGEAVHKPLWAALGCQPPREVVVAPVIVSGQTAILLYAQGRNGARMESFAVSRLDHVCAALARTLVRLA
jgi:Type II secretion system (T2SS), protein E, N-terminal domain